MYAASSPRCSRGVTYKESRSYLNNSRIVIRGNALVGYFWNFDPIFFPAMSIPPLTLGSSGVVDLLETYKAGDGTHCDGIACRRIRSSISKSGI